MRPQGTSFADSARNRDSVMSLGSIAHMQYYFARTGLLDGKGAQLAKEGRKKGNSSADKENIEPAMTRNAYHNITPSSMDGGQQESSSYAVSDPEADSAIADSPMDMHFDSELWDPRDPIMLPPTVSTYKVKPEYFEPLPDMPVLRRELKEALQDACKVLEETQKQEHQVEENSGYYEIQGMHILDIITLAIRAAKNYYTAHEQPQKLYAIRSEKTIRSDLYQVLDILKRMASRNFRGGMRLTELTGILLWIESIDKLIKQEEIVEQQDAAERESWAWREGDWTGRERERECLFMRSFDQTEPALPSWPEAEEANKLPNEFLHALQDGQRLVKLHNALVARSQRRFHEIKTWHTDVAKPYRMADNLRYWIKSAELRWDIILEVPVLDVVNDKDRASWGKFDDAVLKWCQGVRKELIEEWTSEKRREERRRPPELKFETSEDDANAEVERKSKMEIPDTATKVDMPSENVTNERSDGGVTAELAGSLEEAEAQPTPEIAIGLQPMAEVAAESQANSDVVAHVAALETASSAMPVADSVTELPVEAATLEVPSVVEPTDASLGAAAQHGEIETGNEEKPVVATTQVNGETTISANGSEDLSTPTAV